jgi:hypothetical protein
VFRHADARRSRFLLWAFPAAVAARPNCGVRNHNRAVVVNFASKCCGGNGDDSDNQRRRGRESARRSSKMNNYVVAIAFVCCSAFQLAQSTVFATSVTQTPGNGSTRAPIASFIASVPFTEPVRPKFGILTLLPPDTRSGEFIRVSVPVGELVVRGVRAVRAAHYRRAEQKAREVVKRELSDFEAQQRK